MAYTKDTAEKLLRENICMINYTKRSGEAATMRATLMASHLPERETVSESSRKPNPTTLNVYNVDKQDWRSVIVANIAPNGITIAA